MGFYTHGSRVGISGRRFSFIRRMNSFSRLVVFHVEDARYAVRLEDVERVVAAVKLVPLPDAPDLVLGVFNLQGNVVPAIDTRRRSEERRVGKECMPVCRSRWSPYH